VNQVFIPMPLALRPARQSTLFDRAGRAAALRFVFGARYCAARNGESEVDAVGSCHCGSDCASSTHCADASARRRMMNRTFTPTAALRRCASPFGARVAPHASAFIATTLRFRRLLHRASLHDWISHSSRAKIHS
jgi:hypothetical protein